MKYFEKIGEDLGLKRDLIESEESYHRRVAMSALSDWMQTAVFLSAQETSIDMVKRVVKEKFALFCELAPETKFDDAMDLVNYIYEVLLGNGYFLHRNYNIRPAPHRLIGNGGISLVRGMLPEEDVSFTGLAPYVSQPAQLTDWQVAFDLTVVPPNDMIDFLWKRSEPVPNTVYIGEYLNTERKTGQGYYRMKPMANAKTQLGRTLRSDHQYDYYLLRDGEKRRISEDYIMTSFHDYVRLAIMNRAQRQRAIATRGQSDLVHLNLTYLLPRPELRFLRLIAWPEDDGTTLEEAWRFCLMRAVWPIMKERLEFLNYEVIEENE